MIEKSLGTSKRITRKSPDSEYISLPKSGRSEQQAKNARRKFLNDRALRRVCARIDIFDKGRGIVARPMGWRALASVTRTGIIAVDLTEIFSGSGVVISNGVIFAYLGYRLVLFCLQRTGALRRFKYRDADAVFDAPFEVRPPLLPGDKRLPSRSREDPVGPE